MNNRLPPVPKLPDLEQALRQATQAANAQTANDMAPSSHFSDYAPREKRIEQYPFQQSIDRSTSELEELAQSVANEANNLTQEIKAFNDGLRAESVSMADRINDLQNRIAVLRKAHHEAAKVYQGNPVK